MAAPGSTAAPTAFSTAVSAPATPASNLGWLPPCVGPVGLLPTVVITDGVTPDHVTPHSVTLDGVTLDGSQSVVGLQPNFVEPLDFRRDGAPSVAVVPDDASCVAVTPDGATPVAVVLLGAPSDTAKLLGV